MPPQRGVRVPAGGSNKDYERLPETAEAMIYGTMSHIMLRRATRAA